MANSFSRPSMRNLSRQSLPPAGVTNRNMPPPSASLTAFAPGLALRMATSLKGMGFKPLRGLYRQYTPKAGGIELAVLHIPPNHTPNSGWLIANAGER